VSEKLKRKLKTVAKTFSLKYNPRIFNLNWVSKKELVMINYITGNPKYNKFGKTDDKRIKNIEKFLSSNFFKRIIKRYGGCVVSRKRFIKNMKKIKNKEIREVYEKIIKSVKGKERIAFISRPRNIIEGRDLEKIILHEWIHQLLIYNKISLKKINPEFWRLDEGLAIYLNNYEKLKGP